ncbi:MAG: antitoxin [Mycobacteriales bacterium]
MMRTTITLEPDTAALVQSYMRNRGRTFKQAVNELIRASAVRDQPRAPFRTATAELGQPSVNLDRALALAAELEDEELLRKSRIGK